MRIALITIEYITEPSFAGGLANYTYRLACGLRNLGHEAEVFVCGEFEESFTHDGIIVHRLQIRLFKYLRSLQRLNWRLRHDYDIYLIEHMLALRSGLKRRHRERPFDIVHYTHLLGCGALRTCLPSVVRLSSYKDLRVPFGGHTTFLLSFLDDVGLKRADAVFAPSEYVAGYVRSKLNIPVAVIRSPFIMPQEDEDASIWEQHLRARKRYGLYFGSLVEYKGVFVLSQALKTVLEEDKDMHFVFVGRELWSKREGKGASTFILGELAAFKDRVIRFDSLHHAQLFPIIRHADFVTLPSLDDNFPNTCLEAMALEKVVIGTRGRSFDEIFEDGKSGILCEPDDVASLVDAIRRAAAMSPDERQRMGRFARERIDQLVPEKTVAEHVLFYQETINRKRRPCRTT